MSKGKQKLFCLARIFMQETDDNHKLTLPQIMEKLEAVGIHADRKTIYDDIDELRQLDMDIISTREKRNTYYHLGAREFELPELKLLVDSVQASKFITTDKSDKLIKKLEGLVSHFQGDQLRRQVFITGRVKTENEKIYYNVDGIHEAINANVQIRFQYWQWNVRKERELRRGGAFYQVSPWALIWDDENYYLVAYNADSKDIRHYRVDKMQEIKATREPRLGEEAFRNFDLAKYVRSVFGMFTGELFDVTLEGENGMVGTLIDRFGKDIPIEVIDPNHFRTRVQVALSRQFIGWIIALGEGVRITGPQDVVDFMQEEIRRLSRQYL